MWQLRFCHRVLSLAVYNFLPILLQFVPRGFSLGPSVRWVHVVDQARASPSGAASRVAFSFTRISAFLQFSAFLFFYFLPSLLPPLVKGYGW